MTISVLTFSPGTTIKSADVNSNFSAITGVLNGTLAGAIAILATSNSATPITGQMPGVPASDLPVMQSLVTGDSTPRIAQYVRADGYGGIEGGLGSSITSHLYATASGFKTDETMTANVFQMGRGLLRQVGTFSGTGSGTFNHNCGTTPDFIAITENVSNATMTVGVDTIGSTTAHVNTGTASAWIAIAFVTH